MPPMYYILRQYTGLHCRDLSEANPRMRFPSLKSVIFRRSYDKMRDVPPWACSHEVLFVATEFK